jgi:hypothetical protein
MRRIIIALLLAVAGVAAPLLTTAAPASANTGSESVTITPTSGPAGTPITVQGTHWDPTYVGPSYLGTVCVWFGNPSPFPYTFPCPGQIVKIGSDGTFSATVTALDLGGSYPQTGSVWVNYYSAVNQGYGNFGEGPSFTVTGPAPVTVTAPGVLRHAIWGGQVVGVGAHGQFTKIQAGWQVPVLHCSIADDVLNMNSKVKVWTGFGGGNNSSDPDPALVQTGTDSWCSTAGQKDQAWWEVYENLPFYLEVALPASSYPVQPGDYMFGAVFYTGGGTGNTYALWLADSTQNWYFHLICPSAQCAASNGNSIVPVTIPNGYPAHAETIVERNASGAMSIGYPVWPLPNFGQILFTNTQYAYAGTAPTGGFPVYRVEPPIPGKPEMTVSTSLINWTVTWQRSY